MLPSTRHSMILLFGYRFASVARDSPGLEFLTLPKLRQIFEIDKEQYNSIKPDLRSFLKANMKGMHQNMILETA